jgi:4-alpha-glucanotransferase
MLEEKLLNGSTGSQWKEVGIKHHHGVAIPLFSIYSEKSSGIGEYPDLHLLIDFCKEVGFDVIQLLPLNDTGYDTSPYNSISAFALNPIHLSLRHLPFVEKMSDFEEKMALLRKYNTTPRVKYSAVRDLKREFLYEYFHMAFRDISKSEEYIHFCKSHTWLYPYALFKTLKESNNLASWEEWPYPQKDPTPNEFNELLHHHEKEVSFHIFLQFFCFKQLQEAKRYAYEKGVFLKGDIPILISRDSAEVWNQKNLFLLNLSAGAPPDMYAREEGQVWGFPVYNWAEMEKTGFAFWKERLALASTFYHIYRIDHIVGFFRIWAIPLGKKGKEGGYIPPDENTWIECGKKYLEMMLQSAPRLLPIGEDLGTVPPSVRTCLRELGICGTKVIRWERRWNEDRGYIPYSDYIPESMTTVSTHDSDTLQLWWRHSPQEALLFCKFKGWDYKPFLALDRHYEILKDSHHTPSLFHINLLNEYLAIFPELVSPNLHDERINIPGKYLPTNWTYRLKFPLEKLFSHPLLIRTFRELIK